MKPGNYLSIKYLSPRVATRLALLCVWLNRVMGRMVLLPAVFISVTNRCNSRCTSCDIWNGPAKELTPEAIETVVSSLGHLGLKYIVITGGEPLMRSDLPDILNRLSNRGLHLILCTNGILLRQHREEVVKYFDSVIVSLDSHEPLPYKAMRGIDAFDEVLAGIASIVESGKRVSIAHTLQKTNILHLADFIGFSKGLGADSVSVRPFDAYSVGFGSEYVKHSVRSSLLPSDEDLAKFPGVLEKIRQDFSADLASGFITPNIEGLRKISDYFLAKTDDVFPKTRCSAPFSSCVIESSGDVKPCFFAEPFANINYLSADDMKRFINSRNARKARGVLASQCGICRRCAYPYMWL